MRKRWFALGVLVGLAGALGLMFLVALAEEAGWL